jgi:hypothetical protein
MKTARVNFLPNQRFVPLRPFLEEHLAKVGEAISPENFLSICDEMLLSLLKGAFRQVCADEGSIWLLDEAKRNLVITYNSGPNAGEIVGFKQPIDRGIVSLVVATEQGFVENQVYKNTRHDTGLDQKIRSCTYAMMVVPLYFLNQVRGVISCVQLFDVVLEKGEALPQGETPAGFNPEDLPVLQTAASVIRDVVDYRLLSTAVGWKRH